MPIHHTGACQKGGGVKSLNETHFTLDKSLKQPQVEITAVSKKHNVILSV